MTPPRKLPYLGILASLLVFPILRGNKIARISAIGLLVVTIFLTKKEVEDGRKYQRLIQEVGKSID